MAGHSKCFFSVVSRLVYHHKFNHCQLEEQAQTQSTMVGEMVQNSQSLYSFTFIALIDIHGYIYSHSTTKFTFKKYIYLHLPVYFLYDYICSHLRDVFIHVQRVIFIHIHDRNIYSAFSAHHLCASLGPSPRSTQRNSERNVTKGASVRGGSRGGETGEFSPPFF